MGPDETASNRLQAVFEVTNRAWVAETVAGDDHLAPDGRVMEVLSEHLCQGWLEGYLLTGRHGLFNCYEAFIHIVDSMFNQHAKWLKVTRDIPWRRPIASLNYLLSSHVWRQDHNGFSHQDPGFIDHVVNKKAEIIRVYLPPDTNTPAVGRRPLPAQQALRQRHRRRQAARRPTGCPSTRRSCTAPAGSASGTGPAPTRATDDPDVVLGCAGDVPTLETLAAAALLREHLPELKVRVVNVVDLMRLQDEREHPHGLSDREFDTLFTRDKPVVFAYHGYPWLIHRLTYRRHNHANIHVRGYKEEGTTTTPFDMVMLNDLDRYHLVIDVIDRVDGLGSRAAVAAPAHGRRAAAAPRLHPGARRGLAGHPGLAVARRRRAGMRVLTVNTGSSSVKLRVLDADDRVVTTRDSTPDDLADDVGRPGRRRRRGRPPDRARRPRPRGAGAGDRRPAGRPPGAHAAGAAAPADRPGRGRSPYAG